MYYDYHWIVDHNNNSSNHQISYTNNLCKLINFRLIFQVVFVIKTFQIDWKRSWIKRWILNMLLCCLMTKPFEKCSSSELQLYVIFDSMGSIHCFQSEWFFSFSFMFISDCWWLLVVRWKENYCFADAINFHFHYIKRHITYHKNQYGWLLVIAYICL